VPFVAATAPPALAALAAVEGSEKNKLLANDTDSDACTFDKYGDDDRKLPVIPGHRGNGIEDFLCDDEEKYDSGGEDYGDDVEDDWTDGDGQEDDGEDEGVHGNGGEDCWETHTWHVGYGQTTVSSRWNPFAHFDKIII
jgi:hypothetical protein